MSDQASNITELPIVRRNPGLDADFLAHLARVQALPPVYPLYHANVIRNALQAAIPTADGMIVEVSEFKTVGDCRYAITTKDHRGQEYRITVEVR